MKQSGFTTYAKSVGSDNMTKCPEKERCTVMHCKKFFCSSIMVKYIYACNSRRKTFRQMLAQPLNLFDVQSHIMSLKSVFVCVLTLLRD